MRGSLRDRWDRNAVTLRWTGCVWCEHGETTDAYQPGGVPDSLADAMRQTLTAHRVSR